MDAHGALSSPGMGDVEVGPAAGDSEAFDRTRDAEALREAQAAFRELLELAPDAVVVGDADDRVSDLNGAACTLFGYSREELLGKTYRDLLEPEEAARFARERPRAAGRIHVGEWRVKRKDGTFVPVETSLKKLPDGRSLGFVRDITERKRIERERDESLGWVRAVLEQSPVGLVRLHGPRGDRVEYNERAREMLGRPEPTYRDLQSRVCPLDGSPPDPDELPLARALRGQRTAGTDLMVRNAAGVCAPVSVRAGPIVGPDGEVLGAVGAIEDITAAKELERLRVEWSSVVAHDLRQPLTTISLSTQRLVRATEDPALLKSVEHIRSSASRLSRMVGDLMDLSRLEASRLELVRRAVDVPALVRAAAERVELQSDGRAFDLRVEGEVPPVCADPDRISQVLENLLTNAVKYGSAGTPVAMSVSRTGGEVNVAIANEGRALTPEDLARLFQRFQRTGSARVEGIEGIGLGLYITRSLVEAHGGRVTAESTPAGVTTFRVALPIAEK
jgi:PAS domain S-box-containing protein